MTTTDTITEEQKLDLEERNLLADRLTAAGVDFSPKTTLEGLRGLANLLAGDSTSDSSTTDEGAKPEAGGFGETAAGTSSDDGGVDIQPNDSPTGGALFNVDDYADPTLALPPIDGQQVDRIALSFTGTIMLDRTNKDHVALYKRLVTGGEHELWVNGVVTGLNGKKATARDGALDVMVGERKIKIDTIRILGAEDLAEAKLEAASQARDAAENQDARDRLPSDEA